MAEVHTGLYSYPKSGNTWLRALIVAGFDLPGGRSALGKYVPDTANQSIGENPASTGDPIQYFYKSHAKEVLKEHQDKPVKTDRVLYIYRHPLDVFMSYINFLSGNVTGRGEKQLGLKYESVETLTKGQFEMLFSRFVGFGTVTPQNKKFGSIFESYQNFNALKQQGFPVHFIKYEDLKSDFENQATQIFNFLDFDPGSLQDVEVRTEGLTKKDGKFFWKRKSGNYLDFLTKEQIKRFNRVYKTELELMGYL